MEWPEDWVQETLEKYQQWQNDVWILALTLPQSELHHSSSQLVSIRDVQGLAELFLLTVIILVDFFNEFR